MSFASVLKRVLRNHSSENEFRLQVMKIKLIFIRSNFSKDHRDKTEVANPLVVEDLISYKLNDIRKLARLITQ